jgi:hypothetical protein
MPVAEDSNLNSVTAGQPFFIENGCARSRRRWPKGDTKMTSFHKVFAWTLTLIAILLASQTVAQDNGSPTLIVNGKRVDAAVIHMEGRSYVDIEGLAQGVGGSATFEANRITVTIPAPGVPPAPTTPPISPQGMSKEFQQIAVLSLAEMREWRGAISTIISSGMPVVGTWPQDYHDRVEADLMQSSVTASTEQDHQALRPLQREFALISDWADEVVSERNALNAERTIDPYSLRNDPSLAKISKCGQFLNSMIVSGSFSDESSCQ